MTRSVSGDRGRTSRNYFVDEAGDGVLFDRKGRLIVGENGCSRYFMLGVLDIADPAGLSEALTDLREELLRDPYLKGIPSLQPENRKTAIGFHATDDVPEVRREVFRFLAQADLRFQAIVKRKRAVAEYVFSRNAGPGEYHYHPNELYDFTVRRLFKPLLHKYARYNVCFATRGASDRTAALQAALGMAQRRFAEEAGGVHEANLRVWPCPASRCACLQAVDYFLWALQRLYERREERYLASIWHRCSLVIDADDTREVKYGVYYTRKRPLSLAALDDGQGI